MDRAQAAIDKVLSHAYDPVKAHEYYIRTRELKGRDKAAADSSTATSKKTATTPAKGDVNPDQAAKDALHRTIDGKLADIENAMAPVTGKKGAAPKKPKLYSDQDRQKLKQLVDERKAKLAAIADDLYNENLRIGREQYAKLQAVPEVPKGLGILQTRRLTAKRAAAIAKIKGDTQDAKQKARDKAAGQKGEVIAKVIAQRDAVQKQAKQKVAQQLTGAVETANSEYEKLKQDLARLLGRP